MAIAIGVDIGQKRDPTAVCVAEREWRDVEGRTESHFVIRHLERLPLGTPYPRVAEGVARITDQVRARTGAAPTAFVGATGDGQPVVDLVRERVQSGEVVAIWFTYGDQRTESWEGDHLRVSLGKSHMVSRVQVLLGTGRLHLPRTREAGALTDELLNYELRVDQSGHETIGAFKVGTHDGLACALGLATLIDPGLGPLVVLQSRQPCFDLFQGLLQSLDRDPQLFEGIGFSWWCWRGHGRRGLVEDLLQEPVVALVEGQGATERDRIRLSGHGPTTTAVRWRVSTRAETRTEEGSRIEAPGAKSAAKRVGYRPGMLKHLSTLRPLGGGGDG